MISDKINALDEPLSNNRFLFGRPIYFAINPDGRRFSSPLMPKVLRNQLNISIGESIAIAIDLGWVIFEGQLHLNNELWLKITFLKKSLANLAVYRSVKLLLELLEKMYPCRVHFFAISNNRMTVDENISNNLMITRLMLFHYFDKANTIY